jgi:hypothetical protein
METKKEIIDDLKRDLRYYVWQLEDKHLSDKRRRYAEGYRDAVIHYLGLLDAYDESLIEEIKEDYYDRKHEEDERR